MAHHKARNKDPANMEKPFDRSNNELKRLLEESVANIDKKRRAPLRTEQDFEPTFSRLPSDRPSTSQGHDDSSPLATTKRYPKTGETARTRDASPKHRSPKRENVEEDLHSTIPLESKRQHRYLEFEDGNVVHLIRSQEKPLTSGDLTPSRVCSECCLTYFKPDLRSLKTPEDKTKRPDAAQSLKAPDVSPHRTNPPEAVKSKPIKELKSEGASVRPRTKRQQPDKDMPHSSKDPGPLKTNKTKSPETAQLPKEQDDEPIIKCPFSESPMELYPKMVTTKPAVRATIEEQEPVSKDMSRARKELPQSDREKKPVPYVPVPLTRGAPVEQKPRYSERQPSPSSKLGPETTSSGETKPEAAPKPIPPYINIKGVTLRPEILLEVVEKPSEPQDINAKLLIKKEKKARRSEHVPPTSKFEPETKDKRSVPETKKSKKVPYVLPLVPSTKSPLEQKSRRSERDPPTSKVEPEAKDKRSLTSPEKIPPSVPLTGKSPLKQKEVPPTSKEKPETKEKSSFPEKAQEPAPKPIPPYVHVRGVTLRPEILLEIVEPPTTNAAFLNVTERTDSAIGAGIVQKPDAEDASKEEPVVEEKPPIIIAVPSSEPEPRPESSVPEQSKKEEEKPVIEEKPPTEPSGEPEQSKEDEKPSTESQESGKPEPVPEKKTEDDATKRKKKKVAPLAVPEDTLSDTSVEYCPSDEEPCGFEMNKNPVKGRTRPSMMDKFKSRFGAGDKR